MSKILVTTDYLGPGDDVDRLLRHHGHKPVYLPFGAQSPEERLTMLKGFEGAIVASEPVTANMLDAASDLQVLARSGVGYDSIDVGAARDRGVWVCNAPGTNHDSVAEFTMGLILAVARDLADVIRDVRQGQWPRQAGYEVRGATLGVVGYGPSGQAVARLGSALGMEVLVNTTYPLREDTSIEFASLKEVCSRADYLTLHTKASESTHHLIDRARLESMKPTAVLINTARGALVDEDALASALQSGTIAGAALDVLEREPLPETSLLRRSHNVIITSHLAGQTVQARSRAALVAAQAVIDVMAGREPAHPVRE